jgi:hypothetical protein
MMVFKQERFLTIVTVPCLVLAAYALRRLAARQPLIAVAVLTLLFVTSINAISRTRQFYRAGLNDLRVVTEDVVDNPDDTFFGDFWAIHLVKIFTRYQAQNLHVLGPQTTPEAIQGACIMLGGGRGVELLSSYVESTLPPFARNVIETGQTPAEWRLVREIPGPHHQHRLHDFRLYCLR